MDIKEMMETNGKQNTNRNKINTATAVILGDLGDGIEVQIIKCLLNFFIICVFEVRESNSSELFV